jgi:hypothetical protein
MQGRSEQYGQREAKERFKRLVQIALKSPPKPIKSMEPKGVPAQSKNAKKSRKRKAS